MVDRFLVWLGAGVIAAGMSAGMVAGAGLAVATDGAASDASGATTSESVNDTEGEDDSGKHTPGIGQPSANGADSTDGEDADEESGGEDSTTETGDEDAAGDEEATGDDATGDEEATDEEATDEEATDEEAIDEDATDEAADEADQAESDAADSDGRERPASAAVTPKGAGTLDASDDVETGADEKVKPENAEKDAADKGVTVTETESEPEAAGGVQSFAIVDSAAETTETPEVEAVAFASDVEAEADAAAAAPPLSGLLNVIGTIVFNLYAVATRLVGGPPILPANSTVTVRSSTLRIDCGCAEGEGFEVPADWYVPEVEEGGPPPDRLIYLQHGFLAQGPWYSHTAAALAEQTDSIVVAPSITSNFLASNACWLGAPPMQEAVAGLFNDSNTALADSALAAGYAGPIPDRVVLMGHSLGGGVVAGTASYMTENGTASRLAGVVMLDGVGLDDTMTASLDNVSEKIPIYQLAAPTYFWNQDGVGSAALLAARPNQFVGVTLVGGSHVDAMRGGNPLIQFAQELVAGFTEPENAAAAEILMVGWVNDMFAVGNEDEDEGIYLDPSEEFTFDTPAGEATVVALPNSLTKPFFLNFLRQFVSLGDGFFTFEPACVAESVASGQCTGSIAA